MLRFLSGFLTIVVAVLPARADDDLRARAKKDLERFYKEYLGAPFLFDPDAPEKEPSPPPWQAPIKLLSAGNPHERREAATYLREMVALALEHERLRVAPWRLSPIWGADFDMPSKVLRESVARALAEAEKPPPNVLPVLRCFLENETNDAFLNDIMKALGKLDGNEANLLRREVTTKPHENGVVVGEAIKQLAARKQKLPADLLGKLCHHHRAAIRDAARKLNAVQGGADPGPYDPAKAVRSEPVRKIIDQILPMMTELPDSKAELVKATVRYLDDNKIVKETFDYFGWLTRRDGQVTEIYTIEGDPKVLHNGKKMRIDHGERVGNGVKFTEIEVITDVVILPWSLEDAIKEVTEFQSFQISEMRGFHPDEALLGAWLYRAGRDAEAARVLLPMLDSVYRDRYAIDRVRWQLGDLHGQRMVETFAYDRNYEKTLQQARLVDRLLPETRFHDYAKRFIDQLPRRRDDFTGLKLPTHAEWVELRKKLSRDEQIDFLCDRLRMLGRLPLPLSWAEFTEHDKTEQINPLVELAVWFGPNLIGWIKDPPRPPTGKEPTLKDVPLLSKHLLENWFTFVIEEPESATDPNRDLFTTRPFLAEIINELAHKDLCRIGTWKGLKPAEIDKEIERINGWAAASIGKTEVELEWDALCDELEAGAKLNHVSTRLSWLIEHKQAQAYGLLRLFLESPSPKTDDKEWILQMFAEYDASKAKDLAPKYLTHKNAEVRFAAALVAFQTGDKGEPRKIIGDALANDRLFSSHSLAVDLLLKDGSAQSRQQAARVLSNRRLALAEGRVRPSILRSCAAAGMKEPYGFYLPLLNNKETKLVVVDANGKEIGTRDFYSGWTVARSFAREIANEFAGDDLEIKVIARKYQIADQIPHLKKWLESRLSEAKE
jgi:hypothetical protein